MLEAGLRSLNGLTTALLIVVAFGFLVALAGIFGMALFVANRRRRNRPSGTRGFGRRAMRIGKATSAATPTASDTHASVSCHCLSWPRIAPNARPPTATKATAAPSQSKRPEAPSALVSGMCRIVANSAIATSGTLIRNAARQLTVSTPSSTTEAPRTWTIHS